MRIRQIRPEFFTDPVTAHLTPVVRLTYIGLWCVADDAGWLVWDVPHIGALLSPYMSGRAREKLVTLAGVALADAGRLVFYECGCARIPKLVEHQRIGGTKTFAVRDLHKVHTSMDKGEPLIGKKSEVIAQIDAENQEVHTGMDKSIRNVTVGKGNGTREAGLPDGSLAASEFQARVPRPLIVVGKPVKGAPV